MACPLWADCPIGNLNDDCEVNWEDLWIFAGQWLDPPGCAGHSEDCADLDEEDDGINFDDFVLFAENWRVKVGPLVINEFMASNGSTIEDVNEAGEFPDWIELYNAGTTVIELAGMYLTDDLDEPTKWQIPAGVTIEGGEHLLFWADDDDEQGDYHTNFQLDKDGELVGLFDINGVTVIDSITFGEQRYDISCGRFPDANDGWRYCNDATPEEKNNDGYLGIVGDTEFSVDRGFYETAFDVDITCETEGATIRYTLNGSEPTLTNGMDYDPNNQVEVDETTTLRVAAFKTDWLASNVDTQTYIFVDDVITQSPSGQRPGPDWPDPYSASVAWQWIDYGMDPNVVNDPNYAELMDDAMLSVPAISLVTDLDNLFDETTGIYMNASERGIEWERPTSVELIYPDGSEGFQVDAGIRIRGGVSRNNGNPKHSLRLFFRAEYGDAKLEFPMFGDEGVDEFDHLDLRCGQNYSWNYMDSGERATQNRDVFSRDAQRDMGQPYTRSRYYHVYINGQYWGLYQSQERSEASYAESYFGGDKEDYDVIKVDVTQGNIIEATDGELDAYEELWWYADQGFDSNWAYYHVQGLNTDGVRDPNYKVLLDVDNLADYMIVIYYTGNRDGPIGPPFSQRRPRNFYAIYNRNDPDGFKYFAHDCEFTLEEHRSVYQDQTTAGTYPDLALIEYFSPMWLHRRLVAHPEYVMRFADHVHKHFFNDGVLKPAASTGRFMARANEIDLAIIGESARWGDAQRDTPYTRNDDWLPLINAIVDNYFNHDPNTRTDIVLGQFVARGWYPVVEAPAFNQHGGEVNAPFELTISAPEDDIYYTLDGNGPRLPGGAVSSSAVEYDDNPITLTESTHVKARVLDDGEWSALTEATFAIGPPVVESLRITEIMYHPKDTNDPNAEFIELKNIGPTSINLNLVSFTDGIDFTFPWLQLDANEYVLVVKDQVAFAAQAPNVPEGVEVLGPYKGKLDNGGEQIRLEDAIGRTILDFEYKDGWRPITDGGGFSLTIVDPNADPNTWSDKQSWGASTFCGGSPGRDDNGPQLGDIVINELLAHSDTADDWIELYNATEGPINIGGWFLSDDDANLTKYEIADGTTLDANDYIVFYEDANFGSSSSDPGCHSPFALSETGETLYLSSGMGGELTGLREEEKFGASEKDVAFGRYYKSSTDSFNFIAMSINTPGAANAYPKVGPVIINEIMYHPPDGGVEVEYVELRNITTAPVDLFDGEGNSWKFTDGFDFEFPPYTTISAANEDANGNGYMLVVDTDPNDFRTAYSVPSDVVIFGPFDDKNLSNSGEKVEIGMPGDVDGGGQLQYIRIDRVNYSDGHHPEDFPDLPGDPWPPEPDGDGDSLTRIDPNLYGNDPNNWEAAAPLPGE